jgi:hypothetical protein
MDSRASVSGLLAFQLVQLGCRARSAAADPTRPFRLAQCLNSSVRLKLQSLIEPDAELNYGIPPNAYLPNGKKSPEKSHHSHAELI